MYKIKLTIMVKKYLIIYYFYNLKRKNALEYYFKVAYQSVNLKCVVACVLLEEDTKNKVVELSTQLKA